MEEDQKSQTRWEYAIQHYGFDPYWLGEEFIEDAESLLGEYLEKIKSKIQRRTKADEKELDDSFDKLKGKYNEQWDKKLSRLEIYLKIHLAVPSHILLPEDSAWDGLTLQGAKIELETADRELKDMREKYKTLLYKREVLRQADDDVLNVIKAQEAVLSGKAVVEQSSLDFLVSKLEMVSESNRNLKGKLCDLQKELPATTEDVCARKGLGILKKDVGAKINEDIAAHKNNVLKLSQQ